ncbi:uncharacterized protein LOC108033448 [Drosophila biarmipes]|uniref:uncharacterized protein LOC108033448 n=1 Tax=Drosophila biarmipes TaxID=125945 RepID=UPI0007E5E971|nr:uncharacterized protein LOC108033448 [Drosophila biarmipes]
MAKMWLRMKALMLLTGIFFMLYFGLQPLTEMVEQKPLVSSPEEIVFVNSSECHISAPLKSAAFKCAIEPVNKLRCRRNQLITAVTKGGSNFLVARRAPEDLDCTYWLGSARDFPSKRYLDSGYFKLKRDESREIKIGTGQQIVRIKCSNNLNKTEYHDVHYFLPNPDFDGKPSRSPEKLSVMVLGIDSISHMHFHRYFHFMKGFLENLPHITFYGYNRVGLDAYGNLMPFLSGLSANEVDPELSASEQSLLWKIFKMEGYSTAYGEDNAQGILTHKNGEWGSPLQPIDFDLTPVMLEIDNHTRYSIDLREMIHCTAGRKYEEVLKDFILNLIPYMQESPFFSFFWQSQGVQEYYEYGGHLDLTYMLLLKKLLDANVLNNTLVLLMSAHGLRAGTYRMSFQGMKEESQPLMVAIYPDWLKEKYPLAMENFEKNAHSLVTPYDLHDTLMDVTSLDLLQDANIESRTNSLKSLPVKKMPRGISLFLPIPEQRTCDLAHIPSLFCFCRDLTEVPTDDGLVLRCSRFLVESINKLIKPFEKCSQLKLQMVLQAHFLDFGEESFVYELRLRVRTTPGYGIFEATVRLSDALLLTSPISRVNHYLGQSHCVSDPVLKLFCTCI